MRRLRRQIPSLGALAAFEAAARLGGFTRAAGELGVTQAAVSRRIGELERELGRPLFVRAHRRVELTPAGRVLHEAVGASFERMADAVEVVRLGGSDALTVGASVAFAHFWLLPRLSSFRAANPEVQLRVISEDVADLAPGGALDVVLRYGRAPFEGARVLASMAEAVGPVCAPGFAERLGPVAPADLPDLPLIESDVPERSWLGWGQWLSRAGLAEPGAASRPRSGPHPGPRPRLRFSSYSDAAYAAMAGEGVALGWERLLERPLADGRLVRLGRVVVRPAEGHHLLASEEALGREPVEAFVAWARSAFGPAEEGAPAPPTPPAR